MFNIGSGEIAVIAVVALLLLGPKRLPELARGLGKFMREFRRQTDEVRSVVEREFYRMDTEGPLDEPPPTIRPVPDQVARAQSLVAEAAARTEEGPPAATAPASPTAAPAEPAAEPPGPPEQPGAAEDRAPLPVTDPAKTK